MVRVRVGVRCSSMARLSPGLAKPVESIRPGKESGFSVFRLLRWNSGGTEIGMVLRNSASGAAIFLSKSCCVLVLNPGEKTLLHLVMTLSW